MERLLKIMRNYNIPLNTNNKKLETIDGIRIKHEQDKIIIMNI